MKTILYKKDSNGKIRMISIEAIGDSIVQESGVIGSSNLVKHTKIAVAKNVGRANETTPSTQASLEVDSFIKDKLTKAYFLTPEAAQEELVTLPMLAKDFFKERHKIKWGKDLVVVQPKLDGMRCLAFVSASGAVELISRSGKVINNMMHIEGDLSTLGIDIILDGELYVHGEGFQTNMSYVKKYREGKSERIKFNVYDVVSDEPYLERVQDLDILKYGSIEIVKSHPVNSETEVENMFKTYIEEGYEGAMVKISKSGYKSNARSSELLKYKRFIDIQLPILDIIASEQRPTWGQPVYAWPSAKGHKLGDGILGSGTKMTHEEREDLLTNKDKYTCRMAEIRFFEYSDEGVPRFPVTVGIRLDK